MTSDHWHAQAVVVELPSLELERRRQLEESPPRQSGAKYMCELSIPARKYMKAIVEQQADRNSPLPSASSIKFPHAIEEHHYVCRHDISPPPWQQVKPLLLVSQDISEQSRISVVAVEII